MPPPRKIGNEDIFRIKPFELPKPPPKPLPKQLPLDRFSPIGRRNDLQTYGNQQRDRLERLLPAMTAGASNANFAFRGQAFREASIAYHRVINEGIKNFAAGGDTIRLTEQAMTEYRNVLGRYGVKPSESPSFSIANADNFLRSESTRNGGLFTLDQNAVRNLAQSGETPQYLARMIKTGDGPMSDVNQRLAYYDAAKGEGKTIAWSLPVEDLAGSRLDYREVMSRIGWTADDIASANPKDFKIIVYTEEAANRLQQPTEKNITNLARTDKNNFERFQTKPESFWRDVTNYNYEARLNEAKSLGIDMWSNSERFVDTLPAAEQDVMRARSQMDRSMGVNPLFTGDGTTMRPDNVNGRVGTREFITDNTVSSATILEMSKRGQVAFFDMQDLHTTGAPVTIAEQPTRLPVTSGRQQFISETRSGALMGGAFSAAVSTFQAYDQIKQGDYSGAAINIGKGTALGTGVGAFSAAGEQIVGNQIANTLGRSSLVENGLERLSTNGAARNFVSRLAGTESSNITSQTFNSVARTAVGRIGGAGVIGGVVNAGFSAYDQIGAYNRGEVSGSQAIGTITGEAVVGVGAGMAGAAAGAAIGSIIPGAGTLVGAVVGFGVGMAADWVMRQGGVDKVVAGAVTKSIDAVSNFAGDVSNTVSAAADTLADGAKNMLGGAVHSLSSIFG